MLKRSPISPKRATPRRKGPEAPRIKPRRVEDPTHLARVRSLPCIACQMDGRAQTGKTETHHPRVGQGTGTKAPDCMALPLCSRHHNEQHPDSLSIHRNPVEFRAVYGNETELLARTLQALKWRDWVEHQDAEIARAIYEGTT